MLSNHCQNLWTQFAKVDQSQKDSAGFVELAVKEGGKHSSSLGQSLGALEGELQRLQEAWNDTFITLPDGKVLFIPEYETLRVLAESVSKTFSFNLEDFIRDCVQSRGGFVTTIELPNFVEFTDLSLIEKFSHLRRLDLDSTGVTDLSPIRGMTELRDLRLSHTSVSDISPLLNMRNMVKLYMDNTHILDISVLQNMESLEFLKLHYSEVSDISVLGKLTDLRTVSLEGLNLTDISPLLNHFYLKEVGITPSAEVRNLQPEVIDALRQRGIKV